MVPEAELEQTDAGLVPNSVGWFLMNAQDGQDGTIAYARFEPAEETRYPGGLLPDT